MIAYVAAAFVLTLLLGFVLGIAVGAEGREALRRGNKALTNDRDSWQVLAAMRGDALAAARARLAEFTASVRAATPIPRVSMPAPDTTLSPPFGNTVDCNWEESP